MKKIVLIFVAIFAVANIAESNDFKLLSPAKGENFSFSKDNLIKWEGIPSSDTISLEFSTNNGLNWNFITNNATGLSYNWKISLKDEYLSCIIRAKQFNKSSGAIPFIQWAKTFGGSWEDEAYSICQDYEGKYIVVGKTASIDGDASLPNNGGFDFFHFKLDSYGNIIWNKSYGKNGDDDFRKIIPTKDSLFLVQETNNTIEIMNKSGSSLWSKVLSSDTLATLTNIQITKDNGYITCGLTKNEGSYEKHKICVQKINKIGTKEWEKIFGGDIADYATGIIQTNDNNIYIVGNTNSKNGTIKKSVGERDLFVVKLDTSGNLIWSKSFGKSNMNYKPIKIIETKDNNLLIVGYIVDMYENLSTDFIFKINYNGFIIWENNDHKMIINDLINTSDSNYIVCGSLNNNFGLVKISNNNEIIWEKEFGGNESDIAYSLQQTFDNGYIVAGTTRSNDGDVIGNKGSPDCWVVKLSEEGKILKQVQSDSVFTFNKNLSSIDNSNLEFNNFIYPNIVNSTISIDLQRMNINLNFPINCQIYSLSGQLLIEKEINSENYNLAVDKLSDGEYYCELKAASVCIRQTFIVIK